MNRTKQIQGQVDRALDAAREQSWFTAEAHFLKALAASRSRNDWEGMIEIVEGVRQCRQAIRRKALVRGSVRICDDGVVETMELSPGRYLVQPPLVGADARRLIQHGRDRGVPIAVLCREPTTKTGLIPIVAIAPGTTVRVQIEPPTKEAKPSTSWFKSGLEALGESALEKVDPTKQVDRRIDTLLGCLDALPDCDPVYVALAETCTEAAQDQ
ncbi:MAG: hypothetical protein CMJ29_00295 [Phycisphaerae bacterium]|nr:hypothetical protein [Phycisphaerae bacterium]|tara:strand:+ start:1368 stop:2006 length:639 start_codon:yes stop_codon:yes gene_type:complete